MPHEIPGKYHQVMVDLPASDVSLQWVYQIITNYEIQNLLDGDGEDGYPLLLAIIHYGGSRCQLQSFQITWLESTVFQRFEPSNELI